MVVEMVKVAVVAVMLLAIIVVRVVTLTERSYRWSWLCVLSGLGLFLSLLRLLFQCYAPISCVINCYEQC
jgi:hypothetical protein